MPESRTRKAAEDKKKVKPLRKGQDQEGGGPGEPSLGAADVHRGGLLGVAWLVTYYVAGRDIPVMNGLGNWNILIGMGGMAAAFGIATLWQ